MKGIRRITATTKRRSYLVLKAELDGAINRDQFRLFYQPRVDLRTGQVTGAEALLRWQHPQYGLIGPGDFIPCAEASELISSIGEWVLQRACMETAEWIRAGRSPFIVSVNLSPRQFANGSLVEIVRNSLAAAGLPPQYLELEITESMAMDVESAVATLLELKRVGVRISIDDFGKGYSSLAYLRRFPIHTLKIDRAFIRDCTLDENDAVIVKTMIAMAHNLNLCVVAEGVETREQLIFLQKNLCDEVQGYLLQRPAPLHALERGVRIIPSMVSRLGIGQLFNDQMRMEEQLRIARKDLEMTVRKQQGVTFKFKKAGGKFVYTMCDGMLVERIGLLPEHFMGRTVEEMYAAEQAELLNAKYEEAWSGSEDVAFEVEVLGIWCYVTLGPIRKGGQVVEVIGSAVDITGRKQVEEELNAANAQLRLITEYASDLIAILSPDGNILYASPSHERVLGYKPEELLGKFISIIMPPEEIERLNGVYEEAIRTNSEYRMETQFIHRNGQVVTVEVAGRPVLDANGKVTQVVSVGRATETSEDMR